MKTIERRLSGGKGLRIDFLSRDIIRIRISPDGKFGDTLLNRYGFCKTALGKPPAVRTRKTPGGFTTDTGALSVKFVDKGMRLEVTDNTTGKQVVSQTQVAFNAKSTFVEFAAQSGEDWVGFGDQTRDRLYHRGHTADLWVRNVKSYIPVPFFMSTLGAGILVNTTHHIVFDMCKRRKNRYSWDDRGGAVDYYVMVGDGFQKIIDLYTELTGKPKLPPLWSFGLWYVCRMNANDHEAMSDAWNFRREGIPCDVIGLEPGWMEKFYDYSIDKKWHKERFPIPPWAPNGPHNFFNALKRMGFHFELWLCNNYDLTHEAERRAGVKPDTEEDRDAARNFHSGGEIDEHLAGFDLLDKITRHDVPWFEHLKKFVDQGADFFKQDGALQVLEHPDRRYGNARTDAEVHNVYPLLYSRQMYEGFAEYAKRRPLVFTVAGWAGFQAWCGTWTGDTGGGFNTVGGMLNTSLVGHAWTTNDMEVASLEGIHFGYLQPWSQINSWATFRMPWLQGSKLLDAHKYYSRLRSRLVPYLYSWAYRATRTGRPLLTPMTLEFQDDAKCREIKNQYLIGRDLMVVIFKPDTYFPRGRWKDFWTGETVDGKTTKKIAWPENVGGGLYVRSGAIIPFGPEMQYRGEKPVDDVTLYVFPDEGESSFEYYEDDGVTFEHLKGGFAITEIVARKLARKARIEVRKENGNYRGKPKKRRFAFVVAVDAGPKSVSISGKPIPAGKWEFDAVRMELKIDAVKAPCVIDIEF